jgi:hypothetical protein
VLRSCLAARVKRRGEDGRRCEERGVGAAGGPLGGVGREAAAGAGLTGLDATGAGEALERPQEDLALVRRQLGQDALVGGGEGRIGFASPSRSSSSTVTIIVVLSRPIRRASSVWVCWFPSAVASTWCLRNVIPDSRIAASASACWFWVARCISQHRSEARTSGGDVGLGTVMLM